MVRVSAMCSPGAASYAFSTFTRNALNSGQRVFASPTNGVRRLAIEPDVRPTNPQWTGMPTVQTVWPFTSNGLMRRVTMAVPCTDPRFDQTRTWLPFSICFSRARPSGSSTKKSGIVSTSSGTLLVTKCSRSTTR